jgi:hypothetical protein
MASALVTLINFAFTITLCCCHNRFLFLPLFLNSTSLIFWALSLGLLSWNMSATLQHRCNNLSWGTDAGIMVCQTYKALYSFVVIGFVTQIATVVLDVKAHRKRRNRGEYGPMRDDMMLADMKLGGVASSANSRSDLGPSRPQPRSQAGQGHKYQTLASLEQAHASDAREFSDLNPARGQTWSGPRPSVNVDDFSGNPVPEEQTRYDPVDYR